MKNSIFIFLIAFLLFSCNENRIYNEHQDVKGQLTWLQKEAHTFPVEITDASIPYNVSVAIRHHSQVSYDDIKAIFAIQDPDGEKKVENFFIQVRDSKTKELLGEAAGDISDLEQVVLKNHKFPKAGKYIFVIQPDEEGDVSGIMEVGLVVDKVVEGK